MDLKFALRAMRKNPGFTLLGVGIMALGIGANTAVFSVVNAVLLKPLTYRNPERIVTLSTYWRPGMAGRGFVSAPDFHDWHDQSTAFCAMAYYQHDQTSLSVAGAAEYANVALVTPEFWRVFDVEPAIGRFFTRDELKPGGSAAIVVSDSFSQAHFGGRPDILGRTVRMFDRNLTIVGVLPAGFHFPDQTDVWFPANTLYEETVSRSGHNYLVVARLKPDATLAQAQAQMNTIAARLEAQYPGSNLNKGVAVARLRDTMVRSIRLTLWLLLGAVALVLLISCANVANLLLAKATVRTREIAIRSAVGAGRGRIVRQLVTESMLMAAIAGAIGVVIAAWGIDALVALAPADVPRLVEAHIDGSVLVFAVAVSAMASLLFGLAPAVRLSGMDLNEALKQSASRAVTGRTAGKLRAALVVGEIALAVMLLAGAGLLVRSFAALHDVALGFQPDHLLVMETSFPASDDIESTHRAARFFKTLLEDVLATPGVSAAGATRILPGQIGSDGSYFIDHPPVIGNIPANSPNAVLSVVAPGTFSALRIPLERGRDFNDSDQYSAPFTAVINEALARRSFAGQDPIGRTIFCGLDSDKPMRIVGVVGNIRQLGPAVEAEPEIFMPNAQHPRPSTGMNVLVRTDTEFGVIAETLRRKVRALSPDVPVKFTTMAASLAGNTAAPRFRTLLLSLFAGLAACLAVAGVYGVMAYAVNQRSNEIGLRMALGADSADVLRLVLRQGLIFAAAGVVIGLAGALAASRLLTSLLFEVKPTDPLTYAAVAILLALVALAASYIPARRAARIDPLIALREE